MNKYKEALEELQSSHIEKDCHDCMSWVGDVTVEDVVKRSTYEAIKQALQDKVDGVTMKFEPISKANKTPRKDHPNLGSKPHVILDYGELKKAVYCEIDSKGTMGWANGDYWLHYGEDTHEIYHPKFFVTFDGKIETPQPKEANDD